MSASEPRLPALAALYERYLVDHDEPTFVAAVEARYQPNTLERLLEYPARQVRRGAAFALGAVGSYDANGALGRALLDDDRGVRLAAENSIRQVWCRAGTYVQQQALGAIVALNHAQRFEHAVGSASDLIAEAPWIAESWNQRAIAQFGLARYALSVNDCHQTLEINPYHFGAAAGLGHCYLRMGNGIAALESFRRAVRLNPELEAVRATIAHLERAQRRSAP